MSRLILKNINKIYHGGRHAVRNFNLEIEKNELLVLSGPDGCGKSTLLRMIAGLEEITSGSLFINGVDMTKAEPRERNVAMIFRNSVLYPAMTVEENLTFALRMAKMGAAEIAARLAETVEFLKIEELLKKTPDELNEQENFLALIGRALMRRPRLLLMDSTIADFDEDVQEILRQKFLDIHQRLNITVIYVTENRRSAMTLGSRMVVMNDGEICQEGTPASLYERPCSGFVAKVVGYPPMNFFPAHVYEEDGRVGLAFKKGKVLLPEEKGAVLLEQGYLKKEVLAGIRADALTVLEEKKKGVEGTLLVKVQDMETMYGHPVLHFLMDETVGLCMTDHRPAIQQFSLAVDASRIQIFDRETDATIVY